MENLEQEVESTFVSKALKGIKKYFIYAYNYLIDRPLNSFATTLEKKHKEKYPENSPTDLFTKKEYAPKKQRYSDRIIPK